jgi:transketolase
MAVHPSRSAGHDAKGSNIVDEDKLKLEKTIVDTIRCLSMDGVQKANSGHPGTPMAMAPVAYTIWSKFLRFDPQDPIWPNRDRFVLSMGHASMLIYSVLHLAGVKEVANDYCIGKLEDQLPVDGGHKNSSVHPGYCENKLVAKIQH